MFKTEYVLPSPLEILHTILFSGGWVVLPLLPRPAAVGGMSARSLVSRSPGFLTRLSPTSPTLEHITLTHPDTTDRLALKGAVQLVYYRGKCRGYSHASSSNG